MTQGASDKFLQAEVRTEETKRFIRGIKRITHRKFTAEEKIRIVLEGFRGDIPIRDLCRREGIRPSTYYAWLKGFMEAGKESLSLTCPPRTSPVVMLDFGLGKGGTNGQKGLHSGADHQQTEGG